MQKLTTIEKQLFTRIFQHSILSKNIELIAT